MLLVYCVRGVTDKREMMGNISQIKVETSMNKIGLHSVPIVKISHMVIIITCLFSPLFAASSAQCLVGHLAC